MLEVYVKKLFALVNLGFVAVALSACQTTPPAGGYSTITKVTYQPSAAVGDMKIIADENLGNVGAIFIGLHGNDLYHNRLWLNDVSLARHYRGFVWLPVMPGSYKLRYALNENTRVLDVPVKAGETTFILPDSMWAFGPYGIASKTDVTGDDYWLGRQALVLDQPVYMYLPLEKRSLVEKCLSSKSASDCEVVLNDIPPVLLGSTTHEVIKTAVAPPAPQQAPVLNVASKPSSSAPLPQPQPKIASLPPEIERDRLMVQIADLFKANNAVDALPLFDRLNALPVPIDPVSDFYWAQSLLANGDRVGASSKLTRFINTIDAQSPFYAPALRLMTRIEG